MLSLGPYDSLFYFILFFRFTGCIVEISRGFHVYPKVIPCGRYLSWMVAIVCDCSMM